MPKYSLYESDAISKKDLQSLADMRLSDAITLFNGQRFSAAYYLSGYAVECAIKACIAGNFRANTIPGKSFVDNIYKHNLEQLINHAGLGAQLKEREKANLSFKDNWNIVKDWNESARYQIWNFADAASLVGAIKDINNGILPWLRQYY